MSNLDDRQASGLHVVAWDEEDSPMPRWTLALTNHLHPIGSSCALLLEWSTRSDGKWGRRSAYRKTVRPQIVPDIIHELIDYAWEFTDVHPNECLDHLQVHTHGGYSPTRANDDSTICYHFLLFGITSSREAVYLKKDSQIWTTTPWGIQIMALIEPYLVPAE
jgi:hypothetical protein